LFFALVQFVEIVIRCKFRIENEHLGCLATPNFPEIYKIVDGRDKLSQKWSFKSEPLRWSSWEKRL